MVMLEREFAAGVKKKLEKQKLFTEEQLAVLDKNDNSSDYIHELVEKEHAEGLYHNNVLVGAVKRAHDVDVNLSAHVMLENLVTKASNVLSLLELVHKAGVAPDSVDYV